MPFEFSIAKDVLLRSPVIDDAKQGEYFLDNNLELYQVDAIEESMCWNFAQNALFDKCDISGYIPVDAIVKVDIVNKGSL